MELGCNQYVLIVVALIGSSCLATVSKYLSQKKCGGSSVGQAIWIRIGNYCVCS